LRSEKFLDSLKVIDGVIARKRARLLLPGKQINVSTDSLYRYMRLGDFAANNLKQFAIAVEAWHPFTDLDDCAEMIAKGIITGEDTEASVIGRPGYPAWCTDGSLSTDSDADLIRNLLGLKHIEGGYVVEVRYPLALLDRVGQSLRAPTQLDASAGGAANWIFVKNRDRGGPDWGYTAQMCPDGVCRKGVPEAVHSPILISPGSGVEIGLRVLGPIKTLCPTVDYEATPENPDL
jgi:hypothetical protein